MREAANLFALCSLDPAELDGVERALVETDDFVEVARVGRTWITAVAPLPAGGSGGSASFASPSFGGSRLIIAEGREVLDHHLASSGDNLGWGGIVSRALERPESLASLPGDFTFFAMEASGRATAVRSCGGLVPVHVFEDGSLVAMATRVGDLLRFVPRRLEPDGLVWAAVSFGCTAFPDRRGFIAGSHVLARGHAVAVGPDRCTRTVRYFDPRPSSWQEPNPQRRADHVDRLKSLVLSALEDELDPGGANLLSLSGGVDSSTLGALAVNTLGKAVTALSFIPPPGDKRGPLERHYVTSLGESVPFSRQLILEIDPERRLEMIAAAPQVAFPLGHPTFCHLPAVSSEFDIKVVFGGEHADEVCGSAITAADWAIATSTRELVSGLSSLPSGPTDIARWAAWRILWALRRPRTYMRSALPDPIAPEIAGEYREWHHRFVRQGATKGPWRFLTMWHTQDAWVGMGWEAASTLGIRRSLPFLSRAMLELVYDCHPSELVGPGPKRLLRNAFSGQVPEAHLFRPDRGATSIPIPGRTYKWGRPVPEVIRPILGPDWHDTRDSVGFPAVFSIAMLEAAGRSFEGLAGSSAFSRHRKDK